MKKLNMMKSCAVVSCVLLVMAVPLFFAACDTGTSGKTGGTKTDADFSTWNDWLAYKYGKAFGWDPINGLDNPKTPITGNMSAEEYIFSKGLNAGWNLGNTYDLNSNPRYYAGGGRPAGRYDLLMPGIKAAGFNVIRIPVTWGPGDAGGGGNSSGTGANTLVPAAFLDDVEAAVAEAHKAGLAVIINTHHDKGFFRLDLAGQSYLTDGVNGADYISYTERFKAVWSQIALRFKDYGDWLIFESLNEPTVTDENGAVIWDDAPKPAYNQVLSNWNQAFIDSVRDTGGNNDKRYLIFKAYGAKLLPAITPGNGYSWPVDPSGAGRLIFSFHYYIPAGLALDGSSFAWSANNAKVYKSTYLNAQNEFIKKGIPVLCGETSAIFQSARTGVDSIQANQNRLLLLNLIGNVGRTYGIIPCLWDNAMLRQGDPTLNEENHALFKRNTDMDPDSDNWGQPVDYTLRTMSWNNPENAAYNDPDYGVTVINAFIDAVNGKTDQGMPEYSEKLKELMTANGLSF